MIRFETRRARDLSPGMFTCGDVISSANVSEFHQHHQVVGCEMRGGTED
ncbi:hypothetical protein AADZ90_003470 [Aestuariibius sp. 2305UL40-4]